MAGFPPNLTQTFGEDPSTLEIPQQSAPPRARGIPAPPIRGQDEISAGPSARIRGQDEAVIDQLTNRIIAQESSGRWWVTGRQGEIGLGQIMPSTARQYGVDPAHLYDPNVNRALTKRIVSDLYHQFNGDPYLTAAAYNTGPGNVRRGRIPSQTRSYASKAIQGLGNVLGGTPAYAEEPSIGAPPGPITRGVAPTTYLGGPSPAPTLAARTLATPAPTPGPTTRWAAMAPPAQPAGGEAPQRVVNMAHLRASIAHLPADRQQRIIAAAQARNRGLAQNTSDPVTMDKLRKTGEVYRTGPGDVGTLSPQMREDMATDIKHPIYKYLRRPGTAAVGKVMGALWPRFGPTTPEYDRQVQSTLGHMLMPQTPAQAAIMAAAIPMGVGEMAPVGEAMEAEPGAWAALQRGLRPIVRTVPRRVASMAGVGGTANLLTGDPRHPVSEFLSGAEQGAVSQGVSEAITYPAGFLGRLIGSSGVQSQVDREMSQEIGKNMPKGPRGEPQFDLQDLKHPGQFVEEVNDAVRPMKKDLYRRVGKNFKVNMPVVTSDDPAIKISGDPSKWAYADMNLQEANEQLTALYKQSFAPKDAEPKVTRQAMRYRAIADRYKNEIGQRLGPQLRAELNRIQQFQGKAFALERLFKDSKILNPQTLVVDQIELVRGLRANEGDLVRQFGRKGYQDLYAAATRGRLPRGLQRLYMRGSKYGGYEDIPQENPHMSFHPSKEGIMARIAGMLQTYKPTGNVPIWEYPPRAPGTFFVGAPAGQTVAGGLPQYVNPVPTPGEQR